jgi:D-alanyl-lipoteichoic acid acyltransferase DltB (MBOAT superfamily)
VLFNSTDFLIFFAIFLLVYYAVRQHRSLRNLSILVFSYVFYGWWQYQLAGLLLAVSLFDFAIALGIQQSPRAAIRRAWLTLAVMVNLGVLFTFKYLDFFGATAASLGRHLGFQAQWTAFHLVLPIGISFYTFQAMSYVVDVYRREIPATRNAVQFLSYVAFFPQLVAGPIERGARLLPQMQRTLAILPADLRSGLWLMIWGMFKKVVLADNLAPHVDLVFEGSSPGGPLVVLGTIAFALQIYCDFSGYSDIARGAARLLGFDLMLNFNLPYFATSLRDFWRRWHISLSTWLRDYLYVPLGGNRLGTGRTYFNLTLTMLLGGLWHGASLTFVLWGLWHGLGLAFNRWWTESRPMGLRLPGWLAWCLTMAHVLYGWLLFRAVSPGQIAEFTLALGQFSSPPWWHDYFINLVVLASPLLIVQIGQHLSRNREVILTLPRWIQGLIQGAMIFLIALFWQREPPPFIYFQF